MCKNFLFWFLIFSDSRTLDVEEFVQNSDVVLHVLSTSHSLVTWKLEHSRLGNQSV